MPQNTLSSSARTPTTTSSARAARAAKLAAQGWDVTFIIVTNGNKGSHDPGMSPYQLERTARAGAARRRRVLGVKRVIFLRNNDGELESTSALRVRDRAVHSAFQADRGVHARSVEALHAAPRPPRGRLCGDRGDRERARPSVYARAWARSASASGGPRRCSSGGAEQPDHVEDVSGFVDQKIAALIEHHTQLDENQVGGARAPAHGRAGQGARLRGRRSV